jgi:hypothetical protein
MRSNYWLVDVLTVIPFWRSAYNPPLIMLNAFQHPLLHKPFRSSRRRDSERALHASISEGAIMKGSAAWRRGAGSASIE